MRKMTIKLSSEVRERLEELASKRGSTKVNVLRDALALYDLVDREMSTGLKLTIAKEITERNKDFTNRYLKVIKEIVFPN